MGARRTRKIENGRGEKGARRETETGGREEKVQSKLKRSRTKSIHENEGINISDSKLAQPQTEFEGQHVIIILPTTATSTSIQTASPSTADISSTASNYTPNTGIISSTTSCRTTIVVISCTQTLVSTLRVAFNYYGTELL